jgi:RNA polymerase sigma-70 factor (ECF subfamily)
MLKDRAPGAARRMIVRYYESIYAFLCHLCRNSANARDYTHDTYLKAWESIDTLEDGARLRQWLFQIAANVYRHHRRREKVRGKYVDISTEVAEGYEDRRPNPEQELIVAERNGALYESLGELPELLREVLRQVFLEGLQIEEVAVIECAPVGTIKSRLNRAKTSLRRKLMRRKEVTVQ